MKFKKVNRAGILLIISAPSGTGKSTVCRKLLKDLPDLCYSVSLTTRRPRKGEIQGRDYFFVSESEFKRSIREGKLAEWAYVFGNYYGTPRDFLEKNLKKGKDVVMDIDVEGAIRIKKKYPEAVSIFLAPPSYGELKRRLSKRMKGDESGIAGRLQRAKWELAQARNYDYLVVNDRLRDALRIIKCIITAEKNKVKRTASKIPFD